MQLLKWLLQPVYLLLLIVVVALYVNRHVLFPAEVVRSEQAEALVTKIDQLIARMNSGSNRMPAKPVARPLPEQTVAEAMEPPVTPAVAAQPVTAPQPAATVMPKPSPPIAPPQPVVQASPAASPTEALELWRLARAAAWQRELDASVKHYQALISLQPENYDAYGELGNVLLAQYNLAAALDAYARAAQLLQQQGERMQAHRVVALVTQLDRQRGAELYNALSQP